MNAQRTEPYIINTTDASSVQRESIAIVSNPDPPTPATPILNPAMILTILSTLIALLFLVRLWKHQNSLFERLFWSVFLFVPLFGPLFFLVFYPGRSELEARQWAAVGAANHFGGGRGMGL